MTSQRIAKNVDTLKAFELNKSINKINQAIKIQIL